MKTKILKKGLSLLLAAVMVAALVPTGVFTLKAKAAEAELNFAVVSDIHYYPECYMADTEAFETWAIGGNKHYINEQGILNSVFAAFKKEAEENDLKYLIVPGDLTRNGEYEGHKELAEKLKAFEQESGVEVLVINGNHDINNYDAATFENGVSAESARITTPEEFKEIYRDLGYDHAVSCYTPKDGETAGQLSYAASLDGYRFIFIDGGKYSSDNTSDGEDSHETAGNFTDGVMKWALSQIEEAKKAGETPIAVDHWSLVPHYENQANILQGFVLDEFLEVSEKFADAGLHYAFTGHSHSNDVSQHVNDNGEVLWDLQTSSIVEFPHYLRINKIKTDEDGEVTLTYETKDCDYVLPVTDHGVTYEQPYRETFSFNYSYHGSIAEYLKAMARSLLSGLFDDIIEEGGLVKYLEKSIDLRGLLYDYYMGGISNQLMAFIYDLGSQIDEKYIKDKEYTFTVLDGIIDQLCSMEVSELPCLALKEQYGYGDGVSKGTFGDAAFVCLINMAQGDEDLSDPFMQDVIDNFENGDLGEQLFNKLYDLIVVQLAEEEILSNLYVNLDTTFTGTGYEEAGDYIQLATDILVNLLGDNLLGNVTGVTKVALQAELVETVGRNSDTTYLELANAVLKVLDKFGVLEGGSVEGVLEVIMEEYLTESQFEAWGHTFAYYIQDFGGDTDPAYQVDCNGTLSYDGKMPVEATVDNYRLPSLISVSLGNNSKTSRNISWYSKYTLENADIEIVEVEDGETPIFTGKASYPSSITVDATTTQKDREYPGVDLGIVGILPFTLHLQRHIVKLTGLKSGKTYAFRVGDEKKGWWSEIGTFTTADGSKEVTFLHMTDSQGQNEKQYGLVSNVIEKAFELYPDTDLIVHSGDLVDHGDNVNYWKYFFNCNSKLLNTALMPVAGNHEAMGDNAIVDNFVLPKSNKQDTTEGYYYSFDYNNVHFMMLNTNDSDSDGLGEDQLRWLKNDAQTSNAQWKVVVLHKALYSNGSHYDDSEVVAMREQFATLMPKLGIDVVLQGHDHVYLRTDVMKDNQIMDVDTTTSNFAATLYETKVNPDGTVYVITATSGCKNYITKDNSQTDELFPRAEVIEDVDYPAFAGIRIVDDMLYFDAYKVNGTEAEKIDSFAIYKEKILGDADFDGVIESEDAAKILQMAIGLVPVSAKTLAMCDVNGDGVITVVDARLVLKKAAGIESY